jgi:hypothetical protein
MMIVEEGKQLHDEETCPNVEQIKKLKGEIKRLRQDLILKGSSKRKNQEDDMSDEDNGELDEQHKQALRMLPPEFRVFIEELD